MAQARITILTDPNEEETFTYQLSVTLPSGITVKKARQRPGPLPTGTANQVRQHIKQELEADWQTWKQSLKDVPIEGGTWDENGTWNV